MNTKFTPLFITVLGETLKFLLLLFLGLVVTWVLATSLPFDGPELGIGTEISCNYPSGVPIAFMGTWKYWEGGPIHPLCVGDINLIAFAVDVIFWTGSLYLLWYLVKKMLLKLKTAHNV